MDFDRNFQSAARHQTIRTAMICATVLLSMYWLVPILIAALKR
jgi:hypothetical protein